MFWKAQEQGILQRLALVCDAFKVFLYADAAA
jgi:hypothetical protein